MNKIGIIFKMAMLLMIGFALSNDFLSANTITIKTDGFLGGRWSSCSVKIGGPWWIGWSKEVFTADKNGEFKITKNYNIEIIGSIEFGLTENCRSVPAGEGKSKTVCDEFRAHWGMGQVDVKGKSVVTFIISRDGNGIDKVIDAK